MKKERGEYRPAIQPLPPADEQVAEILSAGERHFEEQRLSREERAALIQLREKAEEKKRKAREKASRQKPNRIHLLLPRSLKEKIADISKDQGVSESQVVAFLLFDSIERYERGEIGFWGFKYPSNSPRYAWKLVHPKDTERIVEKK